MRRELVDEERFWRHVLRGLPIAECWEWQGNFDSHGYGRISLKPQYRHIKLAHRASHVLFNGPIPDGYHVDHLCRNTRCVNPNHLEAVPPAVNTMRGVSFSVIYASRTRCNNGHPFLGKNLVIKKDGTRRCRKCHNDAEAARQRRVTALKRKAS